MLILAVLALTSCAPMRGRPTAEPVVSPTPQPATPASATQLPPALATATPSATPVGAVTRSVDASPARPEIVSVPVLGDQLAAGWDAGPSWSTQFEPATAGKSQEGGPGGAPAYRAVYAGDSGGLFFAVKEDSPVRYPASNYVGVRFSINPGPQALSTERLKVSVLSSDRRSYWDMSEAPVPFDAAATAAEAPLPVPGGLLPANQWTKVEIRFDRLPSPPPGRYLTGLYLRAENIPGQLSILVSQIELLGLVDETRPEPVTAATGDLTSLRVSFNKDVNPATAENLAHYQISSTQDPAYRSPKAPIAAKFEADTASTVLTLAQALQPGKEYSVEVQQIEDFAPRPNVQTTPVAVTFIAGALQVTVDLSRPMHAISPYIYGLAGSTPEIMQALRPRLANWGGNPTTRYNWELGNAFNAGSDWEYRNTDYGNASGSVSDQFILDARAVGADVRITLPTLGWVAKNSDSNTCSFVGKDGKCYNPGANCQKPGAVADPARANMPVDVDWVVRWVKHMLDEKNFDVRFFAFDNEPDLWGFTHYDVHPKCTSYDEILNKYLTYATAVRAVAPKAELLGPVSCCWYFYWNSAAGDEDKAKHGRRDFLPWFLDQVRQHDEKAGVRTLDALDIHYYPENVYNDKADPETAAARLEATRALWDSTYVDPSWIAQPVNLLPRMQQIIDEGYPGTKLFISEWNYGGDKSMSGALAIADVLGIFGQQGLYAASYYRSPELNSPGFFGFKMYTNYDDRGSHFGDTALPVHSSDRGQLAVYASMDHGGTGKVTVMLINKRPDRPVPVTLQLDGAAAARGAATGQAELFRFGQDHPQGIARETVALAAQSNLTLPPYSITLLVIPTEGK